MLTTVEVLSPLGAVVLTLPLGDYSNGYSLKAIDGLGPVKAVMSASDYAGRDGQKLLSVRRGSRNIVMGLGFEPNHSTTSVENLRRALYKIFRNESSVTLRFTLDDSAILGGTTFTTQITGTVEDVQPAIFDKNPGVLISVLCHDPDFWLPSSPGAAFGTSSQFTNSGEFNVYHTGDIPVGFTINFIPTSTLTSFQIYVTKNFVTQVLSYTGPSIAANSQISYSSKDGDKYIRKYVPFSTAYSSIVHLFGNSLVWPTLDGTTSVRVYTPGMNVNVLVNWENRYGGL